MKGKYHFKVRSKRALFDFTIRRNITILKGDSATGKTTLLHMLYEYLRVGRGVRFYGFVRCFLFCIFVEKR